MTGNRNKSISVQFKLQRNETFVSDDLWPLHRKPASSLHQLQNKSAGFMVHSNRAAEWTRVLLEVLMAMQHVLLSEHHLSHRLIFQEITAQTESDDIIQYVPWWGPNELGFALCRIPNPLSRPGGCLIRGPGRGRWRDDPSASLVLWVQTAEMAIRLWRLHGLISHHDVFTLDRALAAFMMQGVWS